MAQEVVNGGKVEIHLAGVLRLEWRHLQIHDDKAPKLQVVEEKIELKIVASDFERHLVTDEGEADAELDEELAQMPEEPPFEVAFLGIVGEREEIEIVRVLKELLREVGLWRWQRRLKVRQRLPFPLVKAALDLNDKLRLQPCWIACRTYQSRSSGAFSFSRMVRL